MPFHTHRHSQSLSDPPYSHDNFYGAANAIYSAGQTLSSVGAPTSHWTSERNQQNQQHNNNGSSGGVVIPYRSGPAPYGVQSPNSEPPSASSQFQTPRRTLTIGRQSEELHIPQSGSAMSDVHYGAPPAYGGENLAIHLQPSTPGHPSSAASNPLPDTLQPGQANRPTLLSSASTGPNIPTLPQISTQMQQSSSLSSRPVTLNHSHSYSRSSPGNMDQAKYKPFSNTPEQSKLGSLSSYMSQTPQGPSSYSPLGLADIRPRADTNFSDTPFSPTAIHDTEMQYPSSSNYVAPWPIYAIDWCKWPPRSGSGTSGKIALGSYLEDNHNYIQVLETQKAQIDPDDPHTDRGLDFIKTAEATHAYPVTKILWEPPSSNKQTTDLLATSGDHLRLWSLPNEGQSYQSNLINKSANSKDQSLQKLSPLALLSNSKSPEHTAPITSLDWNVVQPSLIITSSIDTTCTIWDIPTLTAKTQLIAHDKEVFDVRFCANSVDVFVSCGADGSVRMFDLRSLEHSTIIYEPSEKTEKSTPISPDPSNSPSRGGPSSLAFPPPLLRIAASPHDAHLLATFSQDSSIIRVLDVRQPGQALLELRGHGAPINCIEWSNTQRGVLASGADDCCVLVWDLMGSSASTNTSTGGAGIGITTGPTSAGGGGGGVGQERGPSAVWECGFEVANLSWAPGMPTLGVCGGKGLWGVSL